jgi:hypothetical protein
MDTEFMSNPFGDKEVREQRHRAWEDGKRKPRKLVAVRTSRLEELSQYQRIMDEAYTLYKAKGRKAGVEFLASWRDWLQVFQRGADLPVSGELLDRVIKQKETK